MHEAAVEWLDKLFTEGCISKETRDTLSNIGRVAITEIEKKEIAESRRKTVDFQKQLELAVKEITELCKRE